jgi:hypothetical protein
MALALALTTAQMETLRTIAGPLPRCLRTLYLQRIGEALRGLDSVGDGELHRIARGVAGELGPNAAAQRVPDSILINAVCCHGAPWLGQPMQFDQLKRREFITPLARAVAWSLAEHTQRAPPSPRNGFFV